MADKWSKLAGVLDMLNRRPAARAQYDPSIIRESQDLQPGIAAAYDPYTDTVKVNSADANDAEAMQYTIPHEFEHRAQAKYGLLRPFSGMEEPVISGDTRWGGEPDPRVSPDRNNSGFGRRVTAQADIDRLAFEDAALRELAAKNDDYFYDEFGNKTKANTPAASMVTSHFRPAELDCFKGRAFKVYEDI